LSCRKLEELRFTNSNAAGLIVASSVEHAEYIIEMLRDEFNQSAVLVTYKQPDAQYLINQFRHNNTEWIVSVSMISEGIDLPRLQVCCHLSHVKTELYFRQVLGRILRMDKSSNKDAWLYTFAEPKLSEFAHRIQQEIPDMQVLIQEQVNRYSDLLTPKKVNITNSDKQNLMLDIGFSNIFNDCFNEADYKKSKDISDTLFEVVGDFRAKVISTFSSPF